MKDKIAEEILKILGELEDYDRFRNSLSESLKKAAKDYRAGKYGYIEYESARQSILKGKTEQEWREHYSSYIYSLLKRIRLLLNELELQITEEKIQPRVEREHVKTEKVQIVTERKIPKIHTPYWGPGQGQQIDERLKAIRAKLAGHEYAKGENSRYVVVKRPEHIHLQAVEIQETTIPQETEALEQQVEAPLLDQEPEAAKQKNSFPLSPLIARIREGIVRTWKSVLLIPAKAASLAKSMHFTLRMPKRAEPGINAPISGEKNKMYSRQRLQTVQAASRELLFSGILKKIRTAGAFITKIPLRLLQGSIFVAKLPVKAGLGAVRLALSARILGKAGKKKEQQKEAKNPVLGRLQSFFQPRKTIFVEEIVGMEKRSEKKPAGSRMAIGSVLDFRLFKDLLSRFGKKESMVGEQTEIPEHIKKLREMRARIREAQKEQAFEQTPLAREARHVREIIEAEKAEPYKGSSLGAMANLFVKKTSISLVNTFPELFEYLYNGLRTANIKILSNTYVSIMVFVSASLFLAVTSSLSVLFFILNYPLYEIVLKSFFFGFIAAAAAAILIYAYPFMKISERRKNITANMPFAINHLAAVSASGVPPASMLELISDSKEYGEISVEFKKAVDLINVYGYDLLTALRTVSSTTPSPAFKEILDGMVSTIETGGDLESYLKEKAEEATLTYKLERQKYNESISTYSDIYTGVLIAAPLFFVAALAIINLLGGTVAGLGIEAIMAFGAYIAIPLLNFAFLAFLQMNQPEV